jgi:hypothetical protein
MNKTGGLTKGPLVIDLTKDADYMFRPTTTVMTKQLDAIAEFNYNLPPKKKAKETLPDIEAPNVYAKTIVRREPKKGERTLFNKHFNVGIVDECKAHNPDAPINHAAGFSLTNQTKTLQQQRSRLRIASLRKNFGGLISAKDNKKEDIENPFIDGQEHAAMSLSVYNKPKALARPRTANVNILSGIKGLEPVEDENGVPLP